MTDDTAIVSARQDPIGARQAPVFTTPWREMAPVLEEYGWRLIGGFTPAIGRLGAVYHVWRVPSADGVLSALEVVRATRTRSAGTTTSPSRSRTRPWNWCGPLVTREAPDRSAADDPRSSPSRPSRSRPGRAAPRRPGRPGRIGAAALRGLSQRRRERAPGPFVHAPRRRPDAGFGPAQTSTSASDAVRSASGTRPRRSRANATSAALSSRIQAISCAARTARCCSTVTAIITRTCSVSSSSAGRTSSSQLAAAVLDELIGGRSGDHRLHSTAVRRSTRNMSCWWEIALIR